MRGALLRFLLMVAILVTAFLLFRDSKLAEFLDIERLSQTVDQVRSLWWAPLALIGLWGIMSPLGLPATPLVAAGGVIFGTWIGTLYNCLGALLGASTTFFFVRLLGREFVTHLLGGARIVKIEERLETYGFSALVGVRFLPLPWPAVNFAAALAGFRFGPFFLATLIGVGPILFIYTMFFASLADATLEESRTKVLQFLGALALLVLLVVLRLVLRRRTAAYDEPDEADVAEAPDVAEADDPTDPVDAAD